MKHVHCIPKLDQIESFLTFSKKYNAGFEYNEFFVPCILDDEAKIKELIAAYKALDRDRSEDTLHGAFLDICVNSADSMIFEVSDKRIHQSMDIARELGCKAVIFHTNYIPNFNLESYRLDWVEKNVSYWHKLLVEYPDLEVYMENMFDDDPELLKQLAEKMQDESRFGVCLDLAHAFVSTTPIGVWIDELRPYIKHLHINDNDQVQDLHLPVGQGMFPWNEYAAFMESFAPSAKPTILIEVRSFADLITSVEYLKKL